MFEPIPSQAPYIFAFKATGKLTDADYRQFLPQIEKMVREQGRISLLVELNEFEGWDSKAAWDDLKFGLRHGSDFERIAIIGDKSWQHWMIKLSGLFMTSELRFFPREEREQAWDWLQQPHQNKAPKPLQGYRHILLATDFSPHSERAAQRAVELAKRYQAQLSLVHAVEFMPFYDDAYDPIIPDMDGMQNQLEEQALRQLHELAQRLGVEKSAQVEIVSGAPKHAIPTYADEHQVDLIVMGSHGRGGLDRLLGSVARDVLHKAACDVLTIRL